jgi:hypothetical protein
MFKKISFLLIPLCLLTLPVIAQYNIIGNSDLETYEPFWWYPKGVGALRTWATDEVYQGVRSIKIEKAITTPYDVGWQSVLVDILRPVGLIRLLLILPTR